MRTLELVYQEIILDPKIIEFTVEDPATSFSQLRDVVCLKLAIDLGVLSPEMLYPPPQGGPPGAPSGPADSQQQQQQQQQEASQPPPEGSSSAASPGAPEASRGGPPGGPQKGGPHSGPPGVPCAECFRRALKETKSQSVRLTEILALAAVLPDPPPELLEESPVSSSSRRDWRQSDADLSAEALQQQQQQQQQEQQTAAAGQGSGAAALRRPVAAGSPRGPPAKRQGPPCGKGAPGGPRSSVGFQGGPQCLPVRLKIKRRLKRDNFDLLLELPLQQQKAELEKQWGETYAMYYRTIMKLRRLLGRRPAAAAAEAAAEQTAAQETAAAAAAAPGEQQKRRRQMS
ncbi:hypothetical protein ETH_00039005 [Eimeria tenella]|uniref:Uncharacterized protein n=1 Tax=Eimeria tenella TaxID=5802 RepID=U6L8E3_EIMTE|nr:hypothetical protein ETH_00039005 [Eimeria tenella]CDJ44849.1 hypothetical protein ETH_00039005 [Eimeria tenella]|eukprot:XP_013235596.1 hypothetical protein ETH_00039005 [Eimeria tenella]